MGTGPTDWERENNVGGGCCGGREVGGGGSAGACLGNEKAGRGTLVLGGGAWRPVCQGTTWGITQVSPHRTFPFIFCYFFPYFPIFLPLLVVEILECGV